MKTILRIVAYYFIMLLVSSGLLTISWMTTWAWISICSIFALLFGILNELIIQVKYNRFKNNNETRS